MWMVPFLNLCMYDWAHPFPFGPCLLKRHDYFVSADSISSTSSISYTIVGLRLSSALDFSISSIAGLFLITTNKTPLIPGLVPSAWSLLLSDHPEFGSWSKLTQRTFECLDFSTTLLVLLKLECECRLKSSKPQRLQRFLVAI